VQTELLGGAEDPRAMPLKDFIAQTIELLKTEPTPAENCVENVHGLRYAAEKGAFDAVFEGLNKGMEESFNRH
jgi:uncharacterized oxidoreductase